MSTPEEFKKQYNSADTWQQKVIIISLFHSTMCIQKPKEWSMKLTASHFHVSIGLVSENIRLAKELNGEKCEELMKSPTREDGLKLIERRKYARHRVIKPLVEG